MAASNAVTSWAPPVVPFGTEIVTIFVGPEQQKFGVHKDLICASSKFFASAFNGGYAETHSREIRLPELDHKLFGFFYHWLYSPASKDGDPLYQRAQDTECQPDELLLNLYRIADYLLVPGLKLLAIEQMKETFSSSEPSIPSHEFVYLLFEDDQLRFMQLYVIKHIGFWISKSEKRDDWVELIKVHRKVALEMAIEFSQLETTHFDALKVVHPSKIPDFEIKSGLNLGALKVEARANDLEPMEAPGGKVLARAKVLDRFRHLVHGPGLQTSVGSYVGEENQPKRSSDRLRNKRQNP